MGSDGGSNGVVVGRGSRRTHRMTEGGSLAQPSILLGREPRRAVGNGEVVNR